MKANLNFLDDPQPPGAGEPGGGERQQPDPAGELVWPEESKLALLGWVPLFSMLSMANVDRDCAMNSATRSTVP